MDNKGSNSFCKFVGVVINFDHPTLIFSNKAYVFPS